MHCNGASQFVLPMFPARTGYGRAGDAVIMGQDLHQLFGKQLMGILTSQSEDMDYLMHHMEGNIDFDHKARNAKANIVIL